MWRLFVRKAELFLREAEIDFENGCFLKTISASYFAIEHLMKAISVKEFGSFPRKVGALFSLVDKLLMKKSLNEEQLRDYRTVLLNAREIYNLRKDVDHRLYLPDKREANYVLRRSKEVYDMLKDLLSVD